MPILATLISWIRTVYQYVADNPLPVIGVYAVIGAVVFAVVKVRKSREAVRQS